MEQQAIRRQGERELASIIRQDEFRRPIAREMFYTLTNCKFDYVLLWGEELHTNKDLLPQKLIRTILLHFTMIQ